MLGPRGTGRVRGEPRHRADDAPATAPHATPQRPPTRHVVPRACRGVGISRIIDYHHHPSDVVAGALLGAGFGLLYAGRAIARTSLVYHVLAVEAGDLDVLLPSHHEGSGGGGGDGP